MDRVTSFNCKNISNNLPLKLKAESNGNDNDNNEPKHIECIADKLEFKCVWQKPEVDMQLVNQFMNQLNIYNDNEYDDQTPSNLSALLSSSFPSGVVSEKDMDVDEDIEYFVPQFISSTPYPKDSSKIECSSAKQKSDLEFQEFNKVSPIYSAPRRQKNILTKRRLQYSFEFEEFGFERKMKLLKI